MPIDPSERVPVPLTLDEWDPETMTYTIEMRLPKQVTLLDEFEAMVHDEVLYNADKKGLMAVGQALISIREPQEKHEPPKPPEELTEGIPMVPIHVISPVEQAMRDRVRKNAEITASMLGIPIDAIRGDEVPVAPRPVIDSVIVRAEIMIGTAL